jgi:glycine cleavage system aminomethyltransferase T
VPDGVHADDVTAGWAAFELLGAARERVVQTLCASEDDGNSADIGSGSCRWAGAAQIQVFTDLANASTLVLVPADTAAYVWRRMLTVGDAGLVRVGGHLAMEALRIERGIPRFGREATPATHATDIVGARQLLNISESNAGRTLRRPGRRLVAFSSPPVSFCFGVDESILQNGRVVGEITSRACLPGWVETLSLGLLPAACESLTSLQFAADGRHWPLSVRSTVWQPDAAALTERHGEGDHR